MPIECLRALGKAHELGSVGLVDHVAAHAIEHHYDSATGHRFSSLHAVGPHTTTRRAEPRRSSCTPWRAVKGIFHRGCAGELNGPPRFPGIAILAPRPPGERSAISAPIKMPRASPGSTELQPDAVNDGAMAVHASA
jgi:hypothetical protein